MPVKLHQRLTMIFWCYHIQIDSCRYDVILSLLR